MARFTSIGMPKKSFVASAAEEREAASDEPRQEQRAGPSKRKGWGRDPDIASESILTFLSAPSLVLESSWRAGRNGIAEGRRAD